MKPTPEIWEDVISNMDKARARHDAQRAELISEGETDGESEKLAAITHLQNQLELFRATLLKAVIVSAPEL